MTLTKSAKLRDGQKVVAGWAFTTMQPLKYAIGRYNKAYLSSNGVRYTPSVTMDLDNGKGVRHYEGCEVILSMKDAKAKGYDKLVK